MKNVLVWNRSPRQFSGRCSQLNVIKFRQFHQPPLIVVAIMLLLLRSCSCKYPEAALEVLHPSRYQLPYAPAWFGAIVLPASKIVADMQYVGDACECLLGRIAVRGRVALVDRGKCSFLQKVR
jgi:hypothetical protein